MTKAPTVAVAGATGRTGRFIVQELLKRGYAVRALMRSPSAQSHPDGFVSQGVELIPTDLSSVPALEKALQGAQYLISAIGSKKPFSTAENELIDNRGNQNLARAALLQGIAHMVVISSIGVGDSRKAIALIYRLLMHSVLRAKEKSEEYIKSCGISYTIIRPGGYTEKNLPDDIAFGEGGKITGRITRAQIARVCVDALENSKMKNRTFEVVNRATLKPGYERFLITL
ncbi:MAG: SDR family oxidoreductase [Desulfobacterota bacterium]|nr:SDR family oxidoreductase [Thermodesulfobacteriota bacterium]